MRSSSGCEGTGPTRSSRSAAARRSTSRRAPGRRIRRASPFARLLSGDVAVAEPRIGLVTVPTTSGTGSEVSGGVVVVDPGSGRKLGVASPLMRAQHALVDPLLTLGLPPAATMQTGADALAQAIGGVIVRNGNPGSVALGLEACVHVAAGIGPAVADGGDRAARSRLSLGSLLAGLAMNLSDCGADHALGHALGGRLGLPHGLSVGLVLAETLDVDRAACPQALERVADALGEPAGGPADGSRAVRAVRRILGAIGFPTCAQAGVGARRRRGPGRGRPGRLLPHGRVRTPGARPTSAARTLPPSTWG